MLKKTKTRSANSSQKPKNSWKIPNQKVFVLRKSAKFFPILIIAILMIFGAIMLSLVLNNPKSFLAYHTKNEYRPLYDEGDAAKGFYGKVNYYLNEALKDVDSTLENKLTVANLSRYYKRLDFFVPSDSLNYLKRNDEYRLIGFIPDSTNKEGVHFYYNSDFRRLIDNQAKIENLTDRFFNIEFDKKNYPKISKISVDTTRLKMLLFNRFWDGHVSIADPIKEMDPGVLYCYGAGAPFPLFTDSSISCDTGNIYDMRAIPADTFGFSAHIANFLINSRMRPDRRPPTKITYDNEKSCIWFLNTAHGLMVGNDNQSHLKIIVNDKDTIKETDRHCVKKAELVNGITIRLIDKAGHTQKYYYITPFSPYQLASQPVNGSISGARFRIDSADVGFSIWQKMMHLESVMQQSDSQQTVSLSLNAPLSRYLEQEIIRYVAQLKQDKAICDPGSNDIVEMSVCLMDVATGEVLADPFYGNYFSMDNLDEFTARRNFNLELHDIGSTFKPPLYFAAALKFPTLGKFTLSWRPHTYSNDSADTKILGYQSDLYGWKRDERGMLNKSNAFWSDTGPDMNRVNAIATSHDNYPLAVALLSLVEEQDARAFQVLTNQANFENAYANNLQGLAGADGLQRIENIGPDGNKLESLKDLNKSSYYQLLAHLYDVQVLRNTTERVYDNWVIPFLSPTKANFLSPELTSIFDTTFQGAKGYGFPSFRSDILGQGNNRWSNLKLAEAYARILTFNKVHATYIEQNKEQVHFDDLCKNTIKGYPYLLRDTAAMHNEWHSFKQDWQKAVQMKTGSDLLRKAYLAFMEAKQQASNNCSLPDGLEFYCKTGTPQEKKVPNMFQYGDTTVYVDEGLFAFGIVSNAQHPKGITGVVYIKHLSRSPIREVNGVAKGVESREARDFLTEGRIKNILLFTQKRYQ